MRITRRDFRMGERPPWYYGLAYAHPTTDSTVCYPVPINWVVRFARDLFFFLRIPSPGYYEKKEQQIRRAAYEKAYRIVQARSFDENILSLIQERLIQEARTDPSQRIGSIIRKEKKPC